MSNYFPIILNLLSFSMPLLLAATGALFSEYAGRLALFLDGIMTFSAFSFYTITVLSHSAISGFVFTLFLCTFLTTVFSILFEKTKANIFIAAIGLNLLFASLPSFLSSIIFKTRGVLYSQYFQFSIIPCKHFTVLSGLILIAAAILFLSKTKQGLYLRITGTDSDVLQARGINPKICRIKAWGLCGFFGTISGCFLCMRISSFVPNIASGRGWMALAAVFLGNKKPVKITVMTLIFCAADFISANLQNLFPAIPSALLLSLPYLVAIILIIFPEPDFRR